MLITQKIKGGNNWLANEVTVATAITAKPVNDNTQKS